MEFAEILSQAVGAAVSLATDGAGVAAGVATGVPVGAETGKEVVCPPTAVLPPPAPIVDPVPDPDPIAVPEPVLLLALEVKPVAAEADAAWASRLCFLLTPTLSPMMKITKTTQARNIIKILRRRL